MGKIFRMVVSAESADAGSYRGKVLRICDENGNVLVSAQADHVESLDIVDEGIPGVSELSPPADPGGVGAAPTAPAGDGGGGGGTSNPS